MVLALSRRARIRWLIGSLALCALLLTPLVLGDAWLLETAPPCLFKKYLGFECWGCGMTRAFVKISSFSFLEAYALNKLSIPLYGAIVTNALLAASSPFFLDRPSRSLAHR